LGDTKEPIIYRTDIAIKLDGIVSSADSACMNKLIDELKLIIPTRKIFLTKENANVVFKLLPSVSGTVSNSTKFGTSLLSKNFHFYLSSDFTEEARRRTLYFYLYKALVDFSSSKFEYTGVPSCVFDEENPDLIKIQPLDAFILGKLYADDFQVQFKSQYIKQFSYREYLVFMYHNELDLFFQFLGFLFSIILFTVLITKGAFKDHQWNWIAFNEQGMFLILLAILYPFCISLSDLKFAINDYAPIIDEVLSLFLVVNLIYLAERMILKDRNLGGSKIIVIFLTTLILTVVVSIMFGLKANPLGYFGFFPISDSLFPRILVASLARSLFVFLNDRYKSIINQKDVELAQMGEFQKQAELQSLRAKINPHFLYNALNSIASLATTDARKTEQMALALSDFFKYAINREQKQLNTLSEELNAIRNYLEIEKVRFGDRLSFEIDCPEELLEIQIPQLLIQPLVENAIKHGLSQITENGLIRISVSRSENQLKIRVYDNGPAFPDGPLSGFGIQNTQERIALLYGTKATINWQNGEEKYVELCLPVVN
jgi:sensor histidine kinase YesM